jgi:hypothetical protein
MRRRGGLGRGMVGIGCIRRFPLVQGPLGLVVSILAGLALNDLTHSQSHLRSFARRMIGARQPLRVIGIEPAGQGQERHDDGKAAAIKAGKED